VIRAFCLLALSCALVGSACAPAVNAPRPKPFSAPPPPVVTASSQPEFRGYRLAASYVEKSPFRDGAPLRTGALVGGLRVRTDASGLSSADSVAEPPLVGGVQLPSQLGGGLLFWNARALYTTDTFLGLLSPLLEIGFRPSAVSFGPNFVLVHGAEGQRIAIDLHTRQRVPLSQPLLVDLESTADGRVLSLLEGGSAAFSTDAGKTFQALSLPSAEHVVGVQVEGDALVARLSSGALFRLEKGASHFVEASRPEARSRSRGDALWPVAEPPLERALRFGVPLGEEFAGVAVAGSVATVNLRTGELVQMTRALVPSDLDCRALDANGGLLLACMSPGHGTIVLSDVFGERPITQSKFPAGVGLDFADGVLLAASRCDGQLAPGAVCVRGADGRFHDYDVSAKLTALAQSAPSLKPGAQGAPPPITVSRWIPKEGGGALAVVTGPVSGFLDVQSGDFAPLAPEVPRAVLAANRGKEAWLGLDWIALHDGSVRGWLASSGVAIARDGRLDPSVYEFKTVVAAGAHALAFDKGRHAFQSSDWGHTWVETLAPPGSASGSVSMSGPRCSPVGCHLGPWLRVGWEPEVPGALSRAQVAAKPAAVRRAELPTLNCKERAPAVVSEQPLAPGTDLDSEPGLSFGVSPHAVSESKGTYRNFFSWGTVHPLAGAGIAVGLRAGLVTRVLLTDPKAPGKEWLGSPEKASFSFVSAFDPSARVKSASVTWRALFDAAEAAGAAKPELDTDRDATYSALPVLGRDAGQTDGLLLDDNAPVWVHDAGSAEPISLGSAAEDKTVVSAVASGPHALALLVVSSDGSVEVTEVSAGKARRLFQIPNLDPALYPANPDALALGPHGALAVLRTRSGSDPATNAEPALLLDERGAPTPLAPWSRLFAADAPECKAAPNDYRAVLQTSSAWLRVVNGNLPIGDDAVDAGMFALVRVNPDRLCLEALELEQEPIQRTNDEFSTRLSARFVGAGRGATRVGFEPGFELRQPLDCALSGPR
jgi:hypothetical protein